MSSETSFEASINRLEEIVERLDGDHLPLDDALRLFEQGLAELRAATAELSRAEVQVRQLVEQADGTLTTDDDPGDRDD
ncbi:MAG TPA: exodeoxyribonuclease VII small subunit [Gemmatimonadales bacterium]